MEQLGDIIRYKGERVRIVGIRHAEGEPTKYMLATGRHSVQVRRAIRERFKSYSGWVESGS